MSAMRRFNQVAVIPKEAPRAPTQEEWDALTPQQRAAVARAEQEQARAEQEQARAEQEQARAEQEQARAEQACAQLTQAILTLAQVRGLVLSEADAARIRDTREVPLLTRWLSRVTSMSPADYLRSREAVPGQLN